VGWGIRDAVPRKHVVLELGGNAAAVVCGDYASDDDLDRAADRIAVFGTYQAGQSCISVQRVLVDRTVIDRFLPRLIERVAALSVGDPLDEKTDVGPLVDEVAAQRVDAWVQEAAAAGATVHAGGTRDGATYAPTVLTDVPSGARVWDEEVFGPVIAVAAFDGVDEAFSVVNDSRYGLQAGVFTRDLEVAFRAQRMLEVGGVVIGDVPSYRADQMPYGGLKESGNGREGVRSAMVDLTEETVLVLTGIAL
jgi:aldehyde dehydrogenase (NAD+)